MLKLISAAIVFGFAIASPAQAVITLPQVIDFNRFFSSTANSVATGGSDIASFNLFSGAPEKLLGVRLIWTPYFDGSVTGTVRNGSKPTVTASLASSYTLTSDAGLLSFSGSLNTNQVSLATTQNPQPFTLDPVFTAPSPVIIDVANIAGFIGDGGSSLRFNLANVARTTSQSNGSNPFEGHSGNAGGTLTIMYFIDDIPEPGTWAMLIAGFGLTGAAMRRRRRAAAA